MADTKQEGHVHGPDCNHGPEGHGHAHPDPDVQALLDPTHDAFSELVKENIKAKLAKDTDVMAKVDKLGDLGYSLIKGHLDSMLDDVTKK